jgi:hypothetical protein
MLTLLCVLLTAISNAAQIGPLPTVAADGETVVKLLVVADDPTEQISVAIDGQVKRIEPIAGGYLVHWIPVAVTEPTTIPFEVTVTKGEASEVLTHDVFVTPPTKGSISFEFDTATVSSGNSVGVTLHYKGTSSSTQKHRTPLARCNVGTLTTPRWDASGAWRATYTPPADLEAPKVAVLTAIDTTAPEQIFGAAPIAITVHEVLSFDTLPDASTTVIVGDETFGPIIASPAGTVSIPIETHPAVPTAQMMAVHPDGRKKKQKVPLGFTSQETIALAPLPSHAPVGHGFTTQAWCFNPDSTPCDSRKIVWFASAGKVMQRAASKTGPSIVFATVGEEQLNLRVDFREASDTLSLVASAPPLSIGLTLSPPALSPTQRKFSAYANLRTPTGVAPSGITARLLQDNAIVARAAKRSGASTTVDYRKERTATEAVIQVKPIGAPTGLPESQIVGWPARDYALIGANAAHIPITFGVTDAFGIGVDDITVDLTLRGPAMLKKATAKTDKHGLVRVPYILTGESGLVVVTATGDHVRASTALWVGLPDLPVPDLRTTGGPTDEALVAQWQQRAPSAVIGAAAIIAKVDIPDEIALPEAIVEAIAAGEQSPLTANTDTTTTQGSPKVQRWVEGRVNPIRIRITFLAGSPSITQTPDELAESMAPTLDTDGKVMGAIGSLDLWAPNRNWGIELETRATRLETTLEDANTVTMPVEIWAGIRYKRSVSGPVSLGGGVDLYKGTGEITSGSASIASPVLVPMLGGRISADARLNIGDNFLRIRATETLVPYPVLTTVEALLDIGIPSSMIDLSLSAVQEIRSATYSVGDGVLSTTRNATLFTAGIVIPLL